MRIVELLHCHKSLFYNFAFSFILKSSILISYRN